MLVQKVQIIDRVEDGCYGGIMGKAPTDPLRDKLRQLVARRDRSRSEGGVINRIAEQAGIDRKTVSRFINHDDKAISPRVRRQLTEALNSEAVDMPSPESVEDLFAVLARDLRHLAQTIMESAVYSPEQRLQRFIDYIDGCHRTQADFRERFEKLQKRNK